MTGRADSLSRSDENGACADAFIEDAAAGAARVAVQALSAKGGALDIDPDRVERDLTRLVLCLIEFLRQLMEAQAVRRMESGALTTAQEEKLGLTLMRARERLLTVAAEFDLTERDLQLDLGPLGRLV
ncbi:MAG: gas vesicle protein K [Pseudomonadota bacterium]